jgi:hypothetical protein
MFGDIVFGFGRVPFYAEIFHNDIVFTSSDDVKLI